MAAKIHPITSFSETQRRPFNISGGPNFSNVSTDIKTLTKTVESLKLELSDLKILCGGMSSVVNEIKEKLEFIDDYLKKGAEVT